MVEQLDRTFEALADADRRAMLAHLAHGPAAAGDLARMLDMPVSTFLHHVVLLAEAGLVTSYVENATRMVACAPTALDEAVHWLSTQGLRRLTATPDGGAAVDVFFGGATTKRPMLAFW